MNTENTPESYGIHNTGNVLIHLFSQCKADSLTLEQLEWFGGLTDYAAFEADNLAATLDALATLHSHEGSAGALPDASGLASIMCSLADRANTIAALIHVGSESAYLAKEKRQAEAGKTSSGDAAHGKR